MKLQSGKSAVYDLLKKHFRLSATDKYSRTSLDAVSLKRKNNEQAQADAKFLHMKSAKLLGLSPDKKDLGRPNSRELPEIPYSPRTRTRSRGARGLLTRSNTGLLKTSELTCLDGIMESCDDLRARVREIKRPGPHRMFTGFLEELKKKMSAQGTE